MNHRLMADVRKDQRAAGGSNERYASKHGRVQMPAEIEVA
jgi:hypothetical protein